MIKYSMLCRPIFWSMVVSVSLTNAIPHRGYCLAPKSVLKDRHMELFSRIHKELNLQPNEENRRSPWIVSIDGDREGMIKTLSRESKGAGIHIGAAGFMNLDIMAARQSQLGIFFDMNPNGGIVLELIQASIIQAKDRMHFVKLLSERIRKKQISCFYVRVIPSKKSWSFDNAKN